MIPVRFEAGRHFWRVSIGRFRALEILHLFEFISNCSQSFMLVFQHVKIPESALSSERGKQIITPDSAFSRLRQGAFSRSFVMLSLPRARAAGFGKEVLCRRPSLGGALPRSVPLGTFLKWFLNWFVFVLAGGGVRSSLTHLQQEETCVL